MTRTEASPEPMRSGKWKRRLVVCLSAFAVVAVCVAIRAIGGREQATAQQKGATPVPGNRAPVQKGDATSSQQPTVAAVNGEEIRRQELANVCLAEHGKDVLETVMNKYLILGHCEKQGIKITKQEIDEEVNRLAHKFSIPTEQWLEMLKQERGIEPEQYRNDIIWPTLALRKLAANRIQPTEQELDEAYETQYGPAVKALLIVVKDAQTAKEVWAKAQKSPDDFGMLAREHSIDPTSASLNGMIQPIRRGLGDPKVEQVAFQLQEGQISPVIEVKGQYIILKCVGQTKPSGLRKDQVRGQLEDLVRERKLRSVAGDVFKQLQDSSQVVNVYNDPQKRAAMPGVAATINGKTITIRDLAEACIDRHGEAVLEMMIHRKLLEQELKRRKLNVTQKEIDAEIARAAVSAGKVNGGKPDVNGWLKMVEQQGVSMEKYIRDSVWPSTALKLLAGKVEVSEDDLKKGYEANYGRKAQVRAVVLDNQRRAQEVWQKARENPTVEFFGKLAEQYSIEPASRANQGRVPPIQQFGGQPELEEEVFKRMKPGEISGIVQLADKFIIVYLEDFTKPMQGFSREEARGFIYEDIHEKKLRLAMARQFDQLKDNARVDNFLAGTSHSPQKAKAGLPGGEKLDGRAGGRNTAVPAGFETTGLLPKDAPSTRPATGGQPNTPQPRSGSAAPLQRK